jgi:hypothetical protein
MFKKRYTITALVALFLLGLVALANLASASLLAEDKESQVRKSPDDMHETWFTVRIENISDDSAFPGPFAPGAWAVHSEPDPFFTEDEMDRGLGLEAIAEDGNPASLAAALEGLMGVETSGVFNTPVGESGPGPLFPGQAYEFTFSTTMTTSQLSLATMLVQSNDIFASPDGQGIPVFGPDGSLWVGERDITDQLAFWDAGTELNQAPGMGPDQAPRQAGPDSGAAEGVVRPFNDATRALPLADGIADVSVAGGAGGVFTVTVENVSTQRGSISTPIAPVFYATHDDAWSLFMEGEPAGMNGLETLAEDGSPADLVAYYTGTGMMGTGVIGAQDTPVGGMPGPAAPGQSYQFTVMPDATNRFLSIAFMVVQTNDVFIAFAPGGVALLDESGMLRSLDDINADVRRAAAVWDAGTEANEVPGVGLNQPPRQAGPNTGPNDPNNAVRRYADGANDPAGPGLGGLVDVSIVAADGTLTGSFTITVTNNSDMTAYPGLFTPVLWATHNPTASLFTTGEMASAELESLAEDGDASALLAVLNASPDVGAAGVAGAAPIAPGSSEVFSVMLDSDHRYLSLASMLVNSNDTFLAFGPGGIELLDEMGQPRSNEDIAADVEAHLMAWDAGTEHNQAGAAGPDQPLHGGPDTGADEGDGTVRMLDDAVWRYPALSDALRVTITARQPFYQMLLSLLLNGGN